MKSWMLTIFTAALKLISHLENRQQDNLLSC